MTATGWRGYEQGLERLHDAAPAAGEPAGAQPFEPPVLPPPPHVLAAAAAVGRTPAVLWDLPGLAARVTAVRDLAAGYDIRLSAALKACSTRPVLDRLRDWGLSADAATVGEIDLAEQIGFDTITATGPGFRPADIARLLGDGVLFDAQSPTQLAAAADVPAENGLGMRVRVPLPDQLCSSTSRGRVSRFGIDLDPALLERARAAGVRRLRVHTGESTPETLLFRARYAALVAAQLEGVDELNLGGGLLRLSRDPVAFKDALSAVDQSLTEHRREHGVALRSWVEPGAALTLDCAYLVTEVLDTAGAQGEAVTVDASAWNLAPWAFPSFYLVGERPVPYAGRVYGPSLYEKDMFRQTIGAGPEPVRPRPGNRLIATSFGAYTLVHGRRFGEIPLPRQYFVSDNGWEDDGV